MARTIGREAGSGTQSVERALVLLSEFTEAHPQRRVSELVEATGLGQSTVSRLVGALVALGFLAYDKRSGMYVIGPRVVTLAGIALNEMPVHQQARQVAQNLATELDLGANVAERHGAEPFYLCHFEGRSAGRSSTLIGRGGPLHATAMGKALISELPVPERTEILGGELARYTPHTITQPIDLDKTLRQVRERGYATEVEELAFGRACLAAPVRDRTGAIVAALSVSGPLSAMNLAEREQLLATKVIEQADQISSGLGYHAAAAVS
ncbi:transcriptional regulator, IclR family [Kribbella flavida DSM 17836]|uniref:Transcriptional regulator, IclR family n=1 Tax=Kribbella flavida (strain DSM 17836 / JCM 10339 / NBRC 14399) TaxID=479435 RepID=D2PQS6_KRIFD|nr:IclR family transcriptional regulator [Kribbella flavida]ADB31059.1 transcriptional regulator, IclR family [Kribbella flavida DSM 17836]